VGEQLETEEETHRRKEPLLLFEVVLPFMVCRIVNIECVIAHITVFGKAIFGDIFVPRTGVDARKKFLNEPVE
jgi:hypothetical protein